jgi:ABC-type uncharacterized transport system permease subunit
VELWSVAYLLIYAVAAAFYLSVPLGAGDRAARVGRIVLLVAWLVQLGDIGARCLHGQHPLFSTSEAVAFIAWLLAGGFMAATLRYRVHAAGSFAVPVTLVLLVLSRVVPADEAAPLGSLGMAHILLATVGVATFALAAALAVVYLVQERRLKRKRFDRMAGQDAPLDTLDRLAARCVTFGFPIFTLTIVTGAVWVARLGLLRPGTAVRPEYALTVVSWIAFAVLLAARAGVGWRGHRAAWLTLGGFSAAALVLVGYFIRHAA